MKQQLESTVSYSHVLISSRDAGAIRRALTAFSAEVRNLLFALARPGKTVEEFKAMQFRRADRIEASDPAGAAALRRRVARIGMD